MAEAGLGRHFDGALTELNTRFLEQGVGYQYESGEIIGVDSQLIHAEVVKPALAFKPILQDHLDIVCAALNYGSAGTDN